MVVSLLWGEPPRAPSSSSLLAAGPAPVRRCPEAMPTPLPHRPWHPGYSCRGPGPTEVAPLQILGVRAAWLFFMQVWCLSWRLARGSTTQHLEHILKTKNDHWLLRCNCHSVGRAVFSLEKSRSPTRFPKRASLAPASSAPASPGKSPGPFLSVSRKNKPPASWGNHHQGFGELPPLQLGSDLPLRGCCFPAQTRAVATGCAPSPARHTHTFLRRAPAHR